MWMTSLIHSGLDSMMPAIPEPCSEHRQEVFKTNLFFFFFDRSPGREIVGVILFYTCFYPFGPSQVTAMRLDSEISRRQKGI